MIMRRLAITILVCLALPALLFASPSEYTIGGVIDSTNAEQDQQINVIDLGAQGDVLLSRNASGQMLLQDADGGVCVDFATTGAVSMFAANCSTAGDITLGDIDILGSLGYIQMDADNDTGIYSPADDQLGFYAGNLDRFYVTTAGAHVNNGGLGVETNRKMIFDNDGDQDVFIHSPNGNDMIIDGSTGVTIASGLDLDGSLDLGAQGDAVLSRNAAGKVAYSDGSGGMCLNFAADGNSYVFAGDCATPGTLNAGVLVSVTDMSAGDDLISTDDVEVGDDIDMVTTGRILLDSDDDTYITTLGDDLLAVYVGGVLVTTINSSLVGYLVGATMPSLYSSNTANPLKVGQGAACTEPTAALDDDDLAVVGVAQVCDSLYVGSGKLAVGTTSPNAAAIVDVSSTTKGMLMPRMTATQGSAIATPPDGLIIYVTSTDGTFTSVGFWGRTAGAWAKL